MRYLNQVIATLAGEKTRCKDTITAIYHKLQKPGLLSGLSRRYRPKDEEGEALPGEDQQVQYTVQEAIAAACAAMTRLADLTVTLDATNQAASGDIVVDGTVIVSGVPVQTLLFLESRFLVDLRTLIEKIPVLDPATTWTTGTDGVSRSAEVQTVRTKKTPIRFEKAPATERHPAQVEILYEDVVAGYWTKVDFSGAIPQQTKTRYLQRIAELIDAVKAAREYANMSPAREATIGKQLCEHVFG